MSTNPQSVTVKGIAFDNHTIADFMKKLEASPLFNKVDLKRAQSKKYKNGEMLKSFELFCIKNQAVTQEEKKSEKGKK